jgi:hypothetical protein
MENVQTVAGDVISVGEPLRRIEAVAPLSGRKLRVVWADTGLREVVVDLRDVFGKRDIYAALLGDDVLFKTASVSEGGIAVVWSDGAELSASWIERIAAGDLDDEIDSREEFVLVLASLGLNAEADAPDAPSGEVFIDIFRDGFTMEVSYRPDAGFGFYADGDSHFGQRPAHVVKSCDEAVRTVVDKFNTWSAAS